MLSALASYCFVSMSMPAGCIANYHCCIPTPLTSSCSLVLMFSIHSYSEDVLLLESILWIWICPSSTTITRQLALMSVNEPGKPALPISTCQHLLSNTAFPDVGLLSLHLGGSLHVHGRSLTTKSLASNFPGQGALKQHLFLLLKPPNSAPRHLDTELDHAQGSLVLIKRKSWGLWRQATWQLPVQVISELWDSGDPSSPVKFSCCPRMPRDSNDSYWSMSETVVGNVSPCPDFCCWQKACKIFYNNNVQCWVITIKKRHQRDAVITGGYCFSDQRGGPSCCKLHCYKSMLQLSILQDFPLVLESLLPYAEHIAFVSCAQHLECLLDCIKVRLNIVLYTDITYTQCKAKPDICF